jgi:hypothetical protein
MGREEDHPEAESLCSPLGDTSSLKRFTVLVAVSFGPGPPE